MLKSLLIKEVYNSEDDNILEDFYIPALKNSVSYDRSVGYFDAKVLTTAARGLSSFVENGGYMRLIVGATLKEEEYIAISNGYDGREILERFTQEFDESLNTFDNKLFKNQLNTLTWFILNKKLDVKIALRRHGIYHEKIGIIKDASNDFLVFQGSANETNNALSPFNYESINVFKSWLPEFSGHIEPHISKFEKLWSNNVKNTKVLDFTEIAKKLLSRKIESVQRPNIALELELWQNELNISSIETEAPKGPQIPKKLNGYDFILKQHQRDALIAWKDNKFNGIFELATGAGKTITAIYGAVKIFESRKKLFLVIAVPYQSLADQWVDNLQIFNIRALVCYGGESRWLSSLTSKIRDFQSGLLNFVAVVVVDATLSSQTRTFTTLVNSLGEANKEFFLFVGDECHHHGAFANFNALPLNAGLRMGLSATPDRSDEDGNNNLKKYYGDIIAQYTMKNALDDGVLTPYEYHLVEVSLTDEESEQYIQLTKRISKLIAQSKTSKEPLSNNKMLNILLFQRARLINGSQNKPIALKTLLEGMQPIKHSLFYCAEGNLDNVNDNSEDIKQIQVISMLLHSMNWRSSQFTANENKQERLSILQSFKDADIDSLVAMKCLDEGIDVPACSTAFILASSRQPRQFIQRRGRILRKSPGKTKAVIYDFFVTLPIDSVEDEGVERNLFIAELKRINEFSSMSLNKGEIYKKLEPFLKKHDLIHHLT